MTGNDSLTNKAAINKINRFFKSPAFWLFVSFLFLNCLLAFQQKSPFASADEGYVFAQSQYFAGEDFRYLATVYYGYFQALLYSPLFHIFNDNFMVYKGMLFINSVFAALIPVIAYIITNKYMQFDKKKSLIIAIICGLFPPVISYSKLIWNENTLYITLWLIVLLIAKETYNQNNKKQKVVSSILIAFLTIAAIASHNRGIEYLVAVSLIVIIIPFITKRKIVNFPVFLISVVLFFILNYYLSNSIRNLLWVNTGTAANTTGSFLSNLKTIMNDFEAFSMFCKSVIGHLFSIFVSYFGLVCIVLTTGLVYIFRYIKKSNDSIRKNDHSGIVFTLSSFSLVLFFVAVIISVLFYLPGILERASFIKMITSRYIDNAISILIFSGSCIITAKWNVVKKYFWLALPLFFGTAALFFACVKPLIQNAGFTNYEVLQALQLLPFMNFSNTFSNQACIQLILFSSIIFVFVFLFIYYRKLKTAFILTSSIFLFTTLSTFCIIINYYSDYTYHSALQYGSAIKQFVRENPDQKNNLYISHLFESSIPYYLAFGDVLDVTDAINLNEKYDNTFYVTFGKPLGSDVFMDMYYIDTPDQNESWPSSQFMSFKNYLYVEGDALIQYMKDNESSLKQALPHFTYTDGYLHILGNALVNENEDASIILNNGGVQYGPYISLPAGKYKVVVNGINLKNAVFSVTANNGATIIESTLINAGNSFMEYEFEITKDMFASPYKDYLENIEFTNKNPGQFSVFIDSIDLNKAGF